MSIGKVCNREVIFVLKTNTVLEAAQLMRRHHVGDVVVVESREGHRVPLGIVTDRDIVIEVMARGLDANTVTVGDTMSREIISAHEFDGIFETIQLMRHKGVRRVPVVSRGGGLIGIVSIDDLLQLLAQELTGLAHVMPRERAAEVQARP